MASIIGAAFSRTRVVLIAFLAIVAAGLAATGSIPRESFPEVAIPTIHVSTSLEGISPEDAVPTLMKPLETELAAIEGLDEMTSRAAEGGGAITLEFSPGFDADRAVEDVRLAVDRAAPSLPEDATDPAVQEINTALFPIMTVVLSGSLPERALGTAAERLADDLEAIPGILEVDSAGTREEVVDVLLDPGAIEAYGLGLDTIAGRVASNNRLIAAGALEQGDGRLVLKVPGLVSSAEDVASLPLKVADGNVVTFDDVAGIRRALKDPESFARIDGSPAISLEVKKKAGANIVETADAVRATLAAARSTWPAGLDVRVTRDESEQVRTLLGDLQNNVVASIVLVVLLILALLGPRSAFLVGLSIPGSLLSGIAVLWLSGFTLNIVVLFALILVAGMLVDGAIVVIEYADRRMAEGCNPRAAFREASGRMAMPVIASTATTLSVFLPLLFWQGVVGAFMKFLPVTVLITLTASLVMALIVIPVIGGVLGGRARPGAPASAGHADPDPRSSGGLKRLYVSALAASLASPRATLGALLMLMAAGVIGYSHNATGVEFFPASEPDFARIQVLSRDNLSATGRDDLARMVENRLEGHPEIASLYSRTQAPGRRRAPRDLIGSIQIEFTPWDTRRAGDVILEDIRGDLAAIPGLRVSVAVQAQGPGGGKPIALDITGRDAEARDGALDAVRAELDRLGGITDITDTRPLPGFDYAIRVDRGAAARHGADLQAIGRTLRLLTTGLTVSDYQPAGSREPVDIRVRFPGKARGLDRLREMRVPTPKGAVPITTFVEMAPVSRSGTMLRVDGHAAERISADVAPGTLPAEKIAAISEFVASTDFGAAEVTLRGEAEDRAAAMRFLATAFAGAVLLMLLILVAQFNSVSQALLVLSAIVFSIAGVLVGLLVTGRPMSVVMGGIGIIALAGIVVNTNIVLIDTYNERRRAGWPPLEAALRTGAERLRPVLLTTVTTILGLVPLALALGIDIPGREITVGAPSTRMWVDLSLTIVSGLSVATVLTLLATPAVLVLIDSRARRLELDRDPRGPLRRGLSRAWRRLRRASRGA